MQRDRLYRPARRHRADAVYARAPADHHRRQGRYRRRCPARRGDPRWHAHTARLGPRVRPDGRDLDRGDAPRHGQRRLRSTTVRAASLSTTSSRTTSSKTTSSKTTSAGTLHCRCDAVDAQIEHVAFFVARVLRTLTEATHQLDLDKVEDVGIRITQVDRLLDDGCIEIGRASCRERVNVTVAGIPL